MTNYEELLKKLVSFDVDFVIIGGVAAVTHGSAYETRDLDICYRRSKENVKKLVKLLRSLHAKLRGPKEELPFILDEKTFSFGLNFTFTTDLGDFDLLGELGGVGSYDRVEMMSEPIDLCGFKVKVLSLDGLILSKRAANRPKDQAHLKELEAIREMKRIKE